MDNKEVENLVIGSLKDVIEALSIPIEKDIDSETRLFGSRGLLKSLELVSLIVDLEEKILDKYGIALTLADERAMSQKRSPFKSISSLAQYIAMLIDEARQVEQYSSSTK